MEAITLDAGDTGTWNGLTVGTDGLGNYGLVDLDGDGTAGETNGDDTGMVAGAYRFSGLPLDVDYRVHGSGQNEPGTNVLLGADWRF